MYRGDAGVSGNKSQSTNDREIVVGQFLPCASCVEPVSCLVAGAASSVYVSDTPRMAGADSSVYVSDTPRMAGAASSVAGAVTANTTGRQWEEI